MTQTPEQPTNPKRRPKSVRSSQTIDVDSERISKLALAIGIVSGIALLGFVLITAIVLSNMQDQPQVGSRTLAPTTLDMQTATTSVSPTLEATSFPTSTLSPTVTPSAQISNIRFCSIPCDRPGATTQTTYAARTMDIYFAWDYSGMRQGMKYTRDWSNQGNTWVQYRCTWQGPESGTFARKLYDHNGGLRFGTWTIRVVIEGQPVVNASIKVLGNNTYWDPFTETQPCPDW